MLGFLPGKHFEFTQEIASGAAKNLNPNTQPVNLLEQKLPPGSAQVSGPSASASVSASVSSPRFASGKKPIVLVYFIGGVTFSEISALRALSESPSHPFDYLVATTKLINGTSLIDSVQETMINKLKKK